MSDDAQIIDVTDRVAMISGASRGLGEAIARRLIDDGYRVSLGVRDVDATKTKFADVADDRILVEHFDALDVPTAESWFDATLAKFGELHALVNNAGIWRQVNFEKGIFRGNLGVRHIDMPATAERVWSMIATEPSAFGQIVR